MSKTENKGFLKTWKDDRGFGFIKPDDGSDDIFIHVSALKGSSRRPYRGDTIFYQVKYSEDGKSKAVNARIDGVQVVSNTKSASKKWIWVIIAVVLVLISAAVAAFLGMDK